MVSNNLLFLTIFKREISERKLKNRFLFWAKIQTSRRRQIVARQQKLKNEHKVRCESILLNSIADINTQIHTHERYIAESICLFFSHFQAIHSLNIRRDKKNVIDYIANSPNLQLCNKKLRKFFGIG